MTIKAARNAAHVQRAVFARVCCLLGLWCCFGKRQVSHRFRLILDSDMGVPHRHLHVGMPRQFLGLRQGRTGSQQLGDVGMPASRMEICETFGCSIGNAGPLQIGADHLR